MNQRQISNRRTVVATLSLLLAIAGAGLMATSSAATATPPVYPGAVAAARPEGVGFKKPPPQAKTYVTSDDFAKVKAWYKTHLSGALEMQKEGMAATEDAFLVGHGASAMAVLIQKYEGKTYIIIGPALM
jgi:hypothetical protein